MGCSNRYMWRVLASFFMRALRNILLLLVGLLLGGGSVYAFANDIPAAQGYTFQWGGVWMPTVQDVCVATVPLHQSGNASCGTVTGLAYVLNWTYSGSPHTSNYTAIVKYKCPAGYTLSGTMCTLNTPPPPPPPNGCEEKKGQQWYGKVGPVDPATASVANICAGGCDAGIISARAGTSKTDGQIYIFGTWEFTGAECSPGAAGTGGGTPDVSPNNESNPSDDAPSPEEPPKEDTNDADTMTKSCNDNGDGTHTDHFTITHPDGSKDYESVRLYGKCASGGEDPETDYCTANPDATVCKNKCVDNPEDPSCKTKKSEGGDTCDNPPSCDGDAILCASLKQEWLIRCEPRNESKKDPLSQLGINIVAGADPMAGQFPTKANGTVVDVSGSLNTDEMYAASCPPNPTFSLQGHSFTIDYGPLCQFGEIVGYLNILFSMIGAAYILGRG